MIPLVRPDFPDFFMNRWREATSRSNQYSNFGPLWHEAADKLTAMHGRQAFPCSSGTEAVALGLAAMRAGVVRYEAFTFQATRLAAQRFTVDRPLATGSKAADCDVAIRTLPFGSYRAEWGEQNALLIDAAGGYRHHSTVFQDMPTDAAIAVSFHATKNYPIGEGGCLFLPLGAYEDHKRAMAAMNFGFYEGELHSGYASNGKLDELRCAVLLAQLERRNVFDARAMRIAEHSAVLEGECPSLGALGYVPSTYTQSLVVVSSDEPDELVEDCLAAGYASKRLYQPNPDNRLLTEEERAMVVLPSDMTDSELERLIEVLQ